MTAFAVNVDDEHRKVIIELLDGVQASHGTIFRFPNLPVYSAPASLPDWMDHLSG